MCKKVNRWYWKCRDCLGVVAVNESLPNGCRCGACGGEMWCMGQVMGTSRIGHTETRCACDARCTAAPGPNCDCRCGGENHGTGAVVQVDVVTGSVPVARCADSNKLRAIADEWREALNAARGQLNAIRSRNPGRWMPESDYREACWLERKISRALNAKSHSARMKILAVTVAA